MNKLDAGNMQESIPSTQTLNVVAGYIKALAAGDGRAMAALCTQEFVLDFVHRDAFGNDPFTAGEAQAFWPAWFAAFPEMDFQVRRTVAADELVVVEWVFTGTNSGPLAAPLFDPGVEATGKTIRLRGISVFDVETSGIRRETIYLDLGTLLVELGVAL